MADPKDTAGKPADAGSAGATDNPPVVTDWKSGLDPVLAKEPSLAGIKDVGALAKGYVEGQRMIGGSIRLPKPDAKAEDADKAWGEIWGKLGRPETADKYDVKVVKEMERYLPEGDVKAFKDAAHKAGLSNKQAQAVLDHYTAVIATNRAQVTSQAKETETALRGEWGAAFDRNMGLAARAVTEAGGQELLKFLDDSGLGNYPPLIKAFSKIGAILAEEGYMEGDIEGTAAPAEAKDRIASIMSDKSHPYWVDGHPGHKAALAEMQSLYQVAYPEA